MFLHRASIQGRGNPPSKQKLKTLNNQKKHNKQQKNGHVFISRKDLFMSTGLKKGIYLYIYIYLYVYNTVNKENSNQEQDLYTIQYSSEEEGVKHWGWREGVGGFLPCFSPPVISCLPPSPTPSKYLGCRAWPSFTRMNHWYSLVKSKEPTWGSGFKRPQIA